DVAEIDDRFRGEAAQPHRSGGAACHLVALDAAMFEGEATEDDAFGIHAAPPQEKPMRLARTPRRESELRQEARSFTAERRCGQPWAPQVWWHHSQRRRPRPSQVRYGWWSSRSILTEAGTGS